MTGRQTDTMCYVIMPLQWRSGGIIINVIFNNNLVTLLLLLLLLLLLAEICNTAKIIF